MAEESQAEKGDLKSPTSPTHGGSPPTAQDKQATGMSQASKDDLGVCVVIILITVLAIIVTITKIILFDIKQAPIFGQDINILVHLSVIPQESIRLFKLLFVTCGRVFSVLASRLSDPGQLRFYHRFLRHLTANKLRCQPSLNTPAK
eukprot:maker-scaffold508_size152036-snap-gene-0.16 protein:Tk11410 transcript:maker-scaffold508_size152036-snap-gene-0.16-mRNA-1 annotation:"hypothetical protein"